MLNKLPFQEYFSHLILRTYTRAKGGVITVALRPFKSVLKIGANIQNNNYKK